MRTASAGRSLALAQRAEVVRNPLRQHRHDPVGEVDRIAALQRLAVEAGARPHIGRHIRDGDGQDEAARIGRVGIGLGHDGVVVVLGVRRVDGQERPVAPVLSAIQRRGFGGVRLGQCRIREDVRDVVQVERDQAHRLLGAERAQPLTHASLRKAEAGLPLQRDADEVAVTGLALFAGRDQDLAALRALLHGDDPATLCAGPVDADDLGLVLSDDLDDPARIATLGVALDPDQRAVADARCGPITLARAAGLREHDGGRLAGSRPLHGDGQKIAVAVP